MVTYLVIIIFFVLYLLLMPIAALFTCIAECCACIAKCCESAKGKLNKNKKAAKFIPIVCTILLLLFTLVATYDSFPVPFISSKHYKSKNAFLHLFLIYNVSENFISLSRIGSYKKFSNITIYCNRYSSNITNMKEHLKIHRLA